MSALGRGVLERPAVDQEVDDLGDVGGVIAHALDVLGDEQQVCAWRDVARVLHHVGQNFPEQAVIQRVHLGVALPNLERLVGVAGAVRVENILDHPADQPAHPGIEFIGSICGA